MTGCGGLEANTKPTESENTLPTALIAYTLNKYVLPVGFAGKFVISNSFKLGLFLTFVSSTALTSVSMSDPIPSLRNTAKEVIGQPPLSLG